MCCTGAVRRIAALAVVMCAVPAIPDHDGPPGSRFVTGQRIRLLPLSQAYCPDRSRFVARTSDEWLAIAEECGIDPHIVDPALFERRMVVGLRSARTCDHRGASIVGAVIGRRGAMTVRWRHVVERLCPGYECVYDSVRPICLLWSFPKTDRRVRFRRRPTLRIVEDCPEIVGLDGR
jgi:hypothetical protein